jgi:hypothetical protein
MATSEPKVGKDRVGRQQLRALTQPGTYLCLKTDLFCRKVNRKIGRVFGLNIEGMRRTSFFRRQQRKQREPEPMKSNRFVRIGRKKPKKRY